MRAARGDTVLQLSLQKRPPPVLPGWRTEPWGSLPTTIPVFNAGGVRKAGNPRRATGPGVLELPPRPHTQRHAECCAQRAQRLGAVPPASSTAAGGLGEGA